MKIAFIIDRKDTYRIVGPIIDEALRLGWEVECWHNYHHPQTRMKGYQFPSISLVPTFVHGQPVYKAYQDLAELQRWLCQQTVDAIISLRTPRWYFKRPVREAIPTWVVVQYMADSFYKDGPEDLLSCDLIGVYSDWWLQWGASYFYTEGVVSSEAECVRRLTAKAALVGFTELDQCQRIDPHTVRQRWGISDDQPVVLLLTFPGASNPVPAFWPRKIYLEPHPVKQILNMLLWRRFEYWQAMVHGWHDLNVLRAVRRFCDRHGAHLVVKSRVKTPIPPYAYRLADRCLYDETAYPSTTLELLSIATLCISFYSGAALETAALGVPHLCLTFNPEDYYDGDSKYLRDFRSLYRLQEGELFQFQGVCTTMSIPEIITDLPSKLLTDFTIEESAREAYVRKFLGYGDFHSSSRLLQSLEACVQNGRSPLVGQSR